MNGQTSKLLSRFCHRTGRNYLEMKKWYDKLAAPQRAEATKMMREQIGAHREVLQP